MSKLTDHLRALLARFYSKNDAAEVSNLSAPYDKGVSLFIGETTENWQTLASGVASTDGYLAIIGKNKGSAGSTYISVENCSTGVDSLIPLPSTGAMRAFTRIGKGQNFRATAHDAKELDVRFIKTIGAFMGGGSLALIGGGLCLSHSFARFCRASVKAISRCQHQPLFLARRASKLALMALRHLPLQAMAISLSKLEVKWPTLRYELINTLIGRVTQQARALGSALTPQFAKDRQCISGRILMIRRQLISTSGSIRPLVQANLSFGGAL